MKKKIKTWLSLRQAEKPSLLILESILVFNLVLISLTAFIIGSFDLKGTENMKFFDAVFYTISMIFDAGCISYVVADIGKTSVFIVVLCLFVTVIGMITFTGSVIGYVTNYISNFIEEAKNGSSPLFVENHIIILNWNNKAAEIVNDLLYKDEKSIVVIMADKEKRLIESEIKERISDTMETEFDGKKNKLVRVIVRQGDPFSSKQLRDICCEKAKTVVILDSNDSDKICKYEMQEIDDNKIGNSIVVKTLMQVAEICSGLESASNQIIVVESTNNWSLEVINKISEYKTVKGKCEIVPLPVNEILGNIMAQLTIMPDLNYAYNELLSYKGSEFYTYEKNVEDEDKYIESYFSHNIHTVPVGFMEVDGRKQFYVTAEDEKDLHRTVDNEYVYKNLDVNKNFKLKNKNIVVLGHNRNYDKIIEGFDSFYGEWGKEDKNILNVTIIDDKQNLNKNKDHIDRCYIGNIVEAEIYEKDKICDTIKEVISGNGDTNILILSDDSVAAKDIDVYALTNLIYVQDVIKTKKKNEGFDDSMIDIIVEIIDPKHVNIVNNYSIKNVVVSNKFISKMIMQIGEKRPLYEFYKDILTYDDQDKGEEAGKEVYIKQADFFFNTIPSKTTAYELIRDIYHCTKETNPSILLGYVRNGETVIFGGNQKDIEINLQPSDKLVIYSFH